MSVDLETFRALLGSMREEFLGELPERCDSLEQLALALEKSPDERENFNALYRKVHSLKGLGGTHGLSIVTNISHLLETVLAEADLARDFGAGFVNLALHHIDLLREVEALAHDDEPDFSPIEKRLEQLRQAQLQTRCSILVAESSLMMGRIYQQVLADLPLQTMMVNNGLAALERVLHEPFDGLIVGRELDVLNGLAVLAALRTSYNRNRGIPAILVSANTGNVPDHFGVNFMVLRDQHMANNIIKGLKQLHLA